MFSRALAGLIYSKVSAKGIVFPSAKNRGGFNIAVQAEASDRSFHNVSCLVVRMGKNREFGVVDYEVVKSAERLDHDWNFVWPNQRKPETIGMYNLTKEEFDLGAHDPDNPNNLMNMLHMRSNRR